MSAAENIPFELRARLASARSPDLLVRGGVAGVECRIGQTDAVGRCRYSGSGDSYGP